MALNEIDRKNTDKLTIVGGGFSGLLTALIASLEYRLQDKKLRITVIGDQDPTDSPAAYLAASITHNEMQAVMPSPLDAKAFIMQLYTNAGGLAASIKHLNTPKAKAFIAELYELEKYQEKLNDDKIILEIYGKYCMLLWDRVLGLANELQDDKLIKILEKNSSLILPARPGEKDNHQNYRVDIYVNVPNAISKTAPLVETLQKSGYIDAKILSPEEYLEYVPYGQAFVEKYSTLDLQTQKRKWHEDVSIARRPAGRINANQFMRHITGYLEKSCGYYLNENKKTKAFFRFRKREVTKLVRSAHLDPTSEDTTVIDVDMADPKTHQKIETKRKDEQYKQAFYTVNTGSRVDAADKLGIQAPNSALLAGTFIKLKVPKDQLSAQEQEIHTNLALRTGNGAGGVETSVAQFYPDPDDESQLVLHIAGTKTFCGDTEPARHGELDPFAYNRLLTQLNMLRATFPNLLRPILGHRVDQELTREDLDFLQKEKIAEIGVECRNVSATNVSYIGQVMFDDGKVAKNAGISASPSSAGIAFGVGNALGALKSAGFGCRFFLQSVSQTADNAYQRMAELTPFATRQGG